MSVIAGVGAALPDHRYPQEQITEAFGAFVLGEQQDRLPVLRRLHASAQVRSRHLALPLADYATLPGFTAANDAFVEVGLGLAERAIRQALAEAGLTPADVDLVVSTSVTGIAAPSLDARLVARLGLRPDVKRLPLFGLGCVAGAAGVARVHDFLLGHPDGVAVLVAVELCSLTVQRDDTSMANLVASGLFGDGAAAVVMTGSARAPAPEAADHAQPTVVASRSRMYPDTERVMGWDIGSSGFRIVLDATVPDVIEKYLREDVDDFLAEHDLTVADVGTWVAHPGGPKVLEAVQRCLELPAGALQLTWDSLAAVGNLSSASVLQVLRATTRQRRPEPGSPGLMLAMGPGFCAELVLLRW
ncbi:type III polyketide synthase [Jannaschia sp. R86511]|uniref:type III polyketide synthase n=1 Tax=Jannaschia sp. R86511 TaxID=3093853 RepID=UPI0036D25BEC